jgi:hypothetical protein
MAHIRTVLGTGVRNLLFCQSETELRTMNCPDITTLEQAEAKLPSSVLPIDGLRRDDHGVLTDDAIKTIMDGLKSRGVDLSDPAIKQKTLNETLTLFCSTHKQYDFLLNELMKRFSTGLDVSHGFTKMIIDRNLFMMDLLTLSRHIKDFKIYDGSEPFIEGWQTGSAAAQPDTTALSNKLAKDREMLQTHSYEELRKHSVEITMEKNKVASNYLGIYGFLNLIAVGLIIYVAGTK